MSEYKSKNKINIKSKYNNIFILFFYLVNVFIILHNKYPKKAEEILGIFGCAIIPMGIGYLFYWIFTFKIKDKSSILFYILGALGFIIGSFFLFQLIKTKG